MEKRDGKKRKKGGRPPPHRRSVCLRRLLFLRTPYARANSSPEGVVFMVVPGQTWAGWWSEGRERRGARGQRRGENSPRSRLLPLSALGWSSSRQISVVTPPPPPRPTMSTRAPTPGSRGRPPTNSATARPTRATATAAAAGLASHPLRSARSASPGSAGARTPSTTRSRDVSPIRLPSPPAATAAETGPTAVHDEVYPPSAAASAGAHVSSLDQYRAMHARSLADPAGFWGDLASEFHWETPWEADNFTRYERREGKARERGDGQRGEMWGGLWHPLAALAPARSPPSTSPSFFPSHDFSSSPPLFHSAPTLTSGPAQSPPPGSPAPPPTWRSTASTATSRPAGAGGRRSCGRATTRARPGP